MDKFRNPLAGGLGWRDPLLFVITRIRMPYEWRSWPCKCMRTTYLRTRNYQMSGGLVHQRSVRLHIGPVCTALSRSEFGDGPKVRGLCRSTFRNSYVRSVIITILCFVRMTHCPTVRAREKFSCFFFLLLSVIENERDARHGRHKRGSRNDGLSVKHNNTVRTLPWVTILL